MKLFFEQILIEHDIFDMLSLIYDRVRVSFNTNSHKIKFVSKSN